MKDTDAKDRIFKIISYTILIIGAISMLLPFYWMILTSFKTLSEAMRVPPTWWVHEPTLDNYRYIFARLPIVRYFINTIIMTVAATAGELFFCSLAAYAFARLEFPGRDALFFLLIALTMVPFQMIVIPIYLMMVRMNWVNTYAALIIPGMGSAFGTFFLRQAFMNVPKEFEDAAKISGCSYFRTYFSIMIPLCKNAFITLGILTITGYWNDLFWPLIVTTSEEKYVLSVGLATLQKQKGYDHNLLMAAGTFTTIPSLLIFILGQKFFTMNISMGGIKG